MSSNIQRIDIVKNPALPAQTTPEQRYWRSYGNTQIIKEHNAINHICFNPVSPHDFAVTSSTRIQVFSSKTRQVTKNFSRFKDTVYSGEIRSDGKLLVAGDASGLVQIYDAFNPRSLLVTINPSTYPTHVTKFHPTILSNVLTASDDKIVRIYDTTNNSKPIHILTNHNDYVRSADFIPSSSNLVVTGCYDGNVRIFDTRLDGSKPVQIFNQDAPVEDILSLNPTTLVSAGGPVIKVWDIAAGKLIRNISNFQKTVTCLADAGEKGLLAGSLDGHVKIFDTSSSLWEVKFGWKFGTGVLSCGVSPDYKHFVTGLTSGLLSIRTKKTGKKSLNRKKNDLDFPIGATKSKKSNAFAKMIRGAEYDGGYEHRVFSDKNKAPKLKQYEKLINAFKWPEALDSAFVSGMSKELTITILEEIRRRGKIAVALAKRDSASLEPLLTWCYKNIDDDRNVSILGDYVGIIIDLYGTTIEKSPLLEELLMSIRNKVTQEVEKAKDAQRIQGMLELLSI
ncbi:snoRNA-binding rRNA-processing protein UTP15 [Ascoidea rubescens DSM 1968]|uniref:U3 small nucleolar RNA-associated protein 15 n=1 Tax=Ascoidea rubescens DSM 1968 TaxID=1344418 RepID=A0A1D2VBY5_9ASCO|nr:U3 small nucleolar RNA-associated protein 15 [Ascoidea rubescens DSM 1968]ODV59146.1 U3 small nucleolar RNA-associated protein 15 [Ascoidea rubescens DSM 1968]